MWLKDPVTGDPSIPFTLYAMECEGVINTKSEEEEEAEDDDDSSRTPL